MSRANLTDFRFLHDLAALDDEGTMMDRAKDAKFITGGAEPFFLGAILARAGRLQTASRVFALASPGGLNEALAWYFNGATGHHDLPGLYESDSPLSAWHRTAFGSRCLDVKTRWFVESLQSKTSLGKCPTFLDLGTGDGLLLSKILKTLKEAGTIEKARVIVVDKSQAMVETSAETCRPFAEVIPIRADVGAFSDSDWRLLAEAKVDVAIGAESLHHLPWDTKISTFTRLSRIVPHLLLAELEGYHDREPTGSPRLLESIWNFYEPLMRDVEASDLSTEERERCSHEIFLSEVIPLLLEDPPRRENFHLDRSGWLECLNLAGYRCLRDERLELSAGAPSLFLAHLQQVANS